jgi:hypothetical protein
MGMAMPSLRVGKDDKETLQNLFDAYYRMKKELESFIVSDEVDGAWIYKNTVRIPQLIIGEGGEKLPDDVIQSATAWNNQVTEYNNFIASTYTNDKQALQNQIDGNISTWFLSGVPTLVNAPANTWTTNADKDRHLGDLYYDTATGYAYRFMVNTGTYSWLKITDTDITKALADASKAQDTADGKRRNFITTPTPPYDVGDLWSGGTTGDFKVCTVPKALGQSFSDSDWVKGCKYTDDTMANNKPNLIKNGGAEICTGKDGDGIPDGWHKYGSVCAFTRRALDPLWTIAGIASFEVSAGAAGTAQGNVREGYGQNIASIKPSKAYTMSALMDAHRCTVELYIDIFDSSNAWIATQSVNSSIGGSGQFVSKTFTTPATAHHAILYLIKGATNTGETSSFLFADNIKLEEGSVATPYIEVDLSSSDQINNSVQQSVPYNSVKISKDGGIQVFDASNNERIKIGNYTSGKYGMRIKNKAGTATVLDEDGILQSWGDSQADNVNDAHKLKLKFYVPSEAINVKQIKLNFSLEAFRAYETGAASGGGGSSTSANGAFEYDTVTLDPVWNGSWDSAPVFSSADFVPAHDHSFTFNGHTHTYSGGTTGLGMNGASITVSQNGNHTPQIHTYIKNHYHSLNPSGLVHSHSVSIPAHVHGMTYDIYESTTATGVKVYVDGTLRLDNGGGGYTTDQANLDITQWVTTTGWHTVEFSSSRLGRINAAYFMQVFLGV